MKKKIIVIIIAAVVLMSALTIWLLSSTGLPTGMATASCNGKSVALSPVEAEEVRAIFSMRLYNEGIGGCAYEDVTVTFGAHTFALATDGCHTAKDMGNGKCIEINRTEWAVLRRLFEDYFGYEL